MTIENDAQKLREGLKNEYGITDQGGISILDRIKETYIEMKKSEAIVKKEGIVIPDRWGLPRENPANAIARKSRTLFLQALKMLNLDIMPENHKIGRPGGR